ncbi:hypothetical protein WMY93_001889 [Mugilogobius chulae]|uniref:Uncharacterized protein n=1 Tax=Mugilogobius chulae TaxID=88201 RepID=A0AAW0PT97_9GOBI
MVTGRRPEPGSFWAGGARRPAGDSCVCVDVDCVAKRRRGRGGRTRSHQGGSNKKAMNLALERLQQQTRQELEETDEGREVEKETGSREEEKEQDVRTEGQEQTLDVSDEEETAAVEPEGEEFSWSRFENIILSWLSEEQTEERDEQSVQRQRRLKKTRACWKEEKSVPGPSASETEEKESEERGVSEKEERDEQSVAEEIEEKSVPEPSASETEEKESGGRGFSSALRFWLSKEQGVCKKEEKERDEPRVVETKEETEIVEEERQDQSLALSLEEESCPGPSAVFKSEEEESKTSAKTEEQTLSKEEEEKETQRPLDTGYDAVESEEEESVWSSFVNVFFNLFSEEQKVSETEERDEQSVTEAEEIVENNSLLETGLNEEEETKTEEMQPEEQSLNVSDEEEKSVPGPSASETEVKESRGRGFSSALRFWLSKEQGVCEKQEKERDEPRVEETEEETEIVEEERQEQSLALSLEDERSPGPSAVFESEKKESKTSAKIEEQTPCEEEEEEKEAQRPLDIGYDAFRNSLQALMHKEESVPEPSALETEVKESGGRGFNTVLRFWWSKEQGVCEKDEKERDEPRAEEQKRKQTMKLEPEETSGLNEDGGVKTEETLPEEQTLDVSDEEESVSGPSAESEEENSAMIGFRNTLFNWFSKEQKVGETAEREEEIAEDKSMLESDEEETKTEEMQPEEKS